MTKTPVAEFETNDGPEELEYQTQGHPPGLWWLFLSEMWERFCYYGMRALLTIYLINTLMKGDTEAFAIYGAFTALVYAAPVLGGQMADKILGYRIAVILGGILMAIGEFFILGGNEMFLYIGLAIIIVGNGYFKANISSIVGKLYKDGDPKKDSGFTIFYIGINVGALLATLIVAEVGAQFGYKYGFGLAGIGMMAGIFFFLTGQRHFKHVAMPPSPEKLYRSIVGPINTLHLVILGSLALIPILIALMYYPFLVGFLLIVAAVYILVLIILAAVQGDNILRDRLIVFVILAIFNIVFWACFEQAGTSLTLFADRNVDRYIGFLGYTMGAPTTQFFNPAFIIIFGSLFSVMWLKLDKLKMNPNIPAKFGFGLIQLGLGYLVVLLGAQFVGADYLVPLWTIVLLYLLHTTGELFISPIGLSMVTKLAPSTLTGTIMGAWFLSFAASNFLAAEIAKLTGEAGEATEGVAEVGNELAIRAQSLATYLEVYSNMGYITIGVGIILLLLSFPLNKMMHGVK